MADVATIRRLRAAVLGLLLLYVPVVFGVAILSFKIAHTYVPAFVIAGVWLVVFIIAVVVLGVITCPQCSHRFVKYNGVFPTRCARCGFRC
jgi:hypothetical protein